MKNWSSSDNLFFHFSFQSLNVNMILCIGFYVFCNLCDLCWPIVSRNECAFLFIDFSEVIVLLLNGFSCIIPTVHLDTGYLILRPANCKCDWAFFSFRCRFVQSVVKPVSLSQYSYNILLSIYSKHEHINGFSFFQSDM